jgi:ATP-dependent Clp protease protease subunit
MTIIYNLDPLLKYRTSKEVINLLPSIIRVSKFNEDSAKEFSENFEETVNSKQPIIPIVIDSFGGTVYSLLAMIDVINSSPVPVATIVSGKAMSCGAVLFTCGQEGMRYMHKNATLMIHDVSSMTHGKVEEIKSDAAEADRLNSLIYSMMSRNIGKPENYLANIVHEKGHADWYLTAEDALQHNIANKISCPKFSVDVKVSFSFDGKEF